MALAPELIVCDEAISALDVSIQAQVLNVIADVQERTGCSYLFISHDLPVVQRLSHRIAIMISGESSRLQRPASCLHTRLTHTRKC